MASITDNLYYERYNNLKREEYNDFINTFLDSSKKKVLLKISIKIPSEIEELLINPKEDDNTVYDMKIACLFNNAVLSRNLDLVKFINDKYDAINRWKELPERYYTIPYLDPCWVATKYGYIEILEYLSSENTINDKYFQLIDFTAKIINIAYLCKFGYSFEQIIDFLKSIYNIDENTIISFYGSFGKEFTYTFDNIKDKIRNEINLMD